MKYFCLAAVLASASAVSLSGITINDVPATPKGTDPFVTEVVEGTTDHRKAEAPAANTYPPYGNTNANWPVTGDKDTTTENKHDVEAEKAVKVTPEETEAKKVATAPKEKLVPAATAEGGKKDADAAKKEAAVKK